jgi:hypothetical protein
MRRKIPWAASLCVPRGLEVRDTADYKSALQFLRSPRGSIAFAQLDLMPPKLSKLPTASIVILIPPRLAK